MLNKSMLHPLKQRATLEKSIRGMRRCSGACSLEEQKEFRTWTHSGPLWDPTLSHRSSVILGSIRSHVKWRQKVLHLAGFAIEALDMLFIKHWAWPRAGAQQMASKMWHGGKLQGAGCALRQTCDRRDRQRHFRCGQNCKQSLQEKCARGYLSWE